MSHDHPLWAALDRAQMDLRNANARLTEVRAMVAQLELGHDTRPACPTCGLVFQLTWQRDEHLYHAHDGPLPEHYAAAERLAGFDHTAQHEPL